MMTGILAALLSPAIISMIINAFIDKGADVFKSYLNKEITRDQLAEQLKAVFLSTIADVERTHADALTKTFSTFMQAAVQSPLIRYVWATVVLSQLAVLVAVQVGLVTPRSEEFISWAYLLIGGLCGLGPLALRHGPGVLPMQSMRSATSAVR
jgi:hypothetical protein